MKTLRQTKSAVPTDFTLREPNLPKLKKKKAKENLQKALTDKRELLYRTPAEIRKFHKRQLSRNWVRVVLKDDIKYGNKLIVKKGDIVWAEFYEKKLSGGFMFHKSMSVAQREAFMKYRLAAHYLVRVPATRKLSTRPAWDGELFSMSYRVEKNQAKIILVKGEK